MAIETFLERVLGLTHILNSAHPARNEIYYIRCGASDLAFGLVSVAITSEGIRFLDVVLADDTPRVALKSAVLGGTSALTIMSRRLRGRL